MINLLDNAMKYSSLGSIVSITANVEAASVKVAVCDSGIGIPSEEMTHIFEKFYRTKQSAAVSGTGLGLSICKSIIEAHSGRIWAESIFFGGARVNFIIPVNKDVDAKKTKAVKRHE